MVQTKAKKIVSEAKIEELKNELGEFKFGILQRIWEAYNYLLDTNKVENVTDLSKKLRRDYTNVVSIINGKRGVTYRIILDMNSCFGYPFRREWIVSGKGDMLVNPNEDAKMPSAAINQAWATNSPNAIVNAAYNGNVTVSGSGNAVLNKYGDRSDMDRRWCPVVPVNMAKQPDLDVLDEIMQRGEDGIEFLYSGTAQLDLWYYIQDNDLYPHYQKGDCVGLKAYAKDDRRVKTGNVYVVDTVRDGFVFRRLRLAENGDFVAYTFSDSDSQSYVIPQEDVIRVYSVVLMFRY